MKNIVSYIKFKYQVKKLNKMIATRRKELDKLLLQKKQYEEQDDHGDFMKDKYCPLVVVPKTCYSFPYIQPKICFNSFMLELVDNGFNCSIACFKDNYKYLTWFVDLYAYLQLQDTRKRKLRNLNHDIKDALDYIDFYTQKKEELENEFRNN